MSRLNAMDIHSIQESLCSYKKLLEWLPVQDTQEEYLKAERINVVSYLIDKAEQVLRGMQNEQGNN